MRPGKELSCVANTSGSVVMRRGLSERLSEGFPVFSFFSLNHSLTKCFFVLGYFVGHLLSVGTSVSAIISASAVSVSGSIAFLFISVYFFFLPNCSVTSSIMLNESGKNVGILVLFLILEEKLSGFHH